MADASLQTGFTKIYQFLAQQGDWKTQADANGDGYVLKTEFASFMEGFTWDENGTGIKKDDLVSNFFSSIDTNTKGRISDCSKLSNKNALTKTEQEKLQVKIEAYTCLDTFFGETDLNCPSFISNTSGWENSIYDSLVNTMEATYLKTATTFEEEKLIEILENALPVAKNKAAADYYAYEFMDSTYIKGALAEAGLEDYTYSTDNELGKLISAYISTLKGGDEEEAKIEVMIGAIIENYLSTAGIGSYDSSVELDSKFQPDTSESAPLNEIQKMRLQKKITSDLETLKTSDAEYETYKDLYDTAFTEYLAEEVTAAKNGDFADLIATDFSAKFAESAAYTKLSNTITVKKAMGGEALQKLIAEDDTLKALTSLGEKFAKDSKYLTALKTIEAKAIEKATNGEFDTNGVFDEAKLKAFIIDQLKANIESFYSGGMSGMKLTELNAVYDILTEAANSPELSDDESLKAHRNAALKYCNALASKSTLFKEQVQIVFGDNYSTEINSMLPSDIEAKIQELKERIEDIGDPSEMKVNWGSEVQDSMTVGAGMSKTFNLISSVTTNGSNSTVQTDRITYKSSNSNITIDASGKATLKVPAEGNYSATVSVLVDGVEVAKKDITITAVKPTISKDNILNVYNAGKQWLCGWTPDCGDGIKNCMKSNIANHVNAMVNALKAAGYPEAQLSKAAQTTINYYNAFIDTININNDDGSTNSFSYQRADGTTATASLSYYKQTKKKEKDVDTIANCGKDGASGIAIGESWRNTDTYNAAIDTSVLAQRFAEFFNAL